MRETLKFVFLMFLVVASPARASDDAPKRSPEELIRLANDGADLADEGRYEDASRVWRDILPETTGADQLDLQYNLYFAHKKMGKLPEAWHFLRAYLKNSEKEDREAGAALEKLEKQLLGGEYVKVAITCEPSDALIHLGKTATGPRYSCPLTWWFRSVEKYKHFIHVHKEGHLPKTVELDLIKRGAKGGTKVTLTPKNAIPLKDLKPVDPVVTMKTDRPGARPNNSWKWALVGTGAAIAIGGGISHGLGEKDLRDLNDKYSAGGTVIDVATKNAYEREYDDKVLPKRLSAYVLYGIGAATAATGMVFLFIKDQAGNGGDGNKIVTPLWFDGGGGLSVGLQY